MTTKKSKLQKDLDRHNKHHTYDAMSRFYAEHTSLDGLMIKSTKLNDIRFIESRLCAARRIHQRLLDQWHQIFNAIPTPAPRDAYTNVYGMDKSGKPWCLQKSRDSVSRDRVTEREELFLLMGDGEILTHVNDEFSDSVEDRKAKEVLHMRLSGDQPRLPLQNDLVLAYWSNEERCMHCCRVKQRYEQLYHRYMRDKYVQWTHNSCPYLRFVMKDAAGNETVAQHMWHTVNGRRYLWRIGDNNRDLIREMGPDDHVIDVED